MDTENPFRGNAPIELRATPPQLLTERVGVGRVLLRLLATWWILGLAFWAWVADRLFIRRVFYLFVPRRYEPLPWTRALRLAFERLGPTYIKFGQVIASSKGLFPEALCEEMRAVLDDVPPEPFERTRRTIEEMFDAPLATLFDRFEEAPMAAASIAQVHGATLPDGTDVVVKVQRPNLPLRVGADLRVMGAAARFAERVSHEARLGNLSGIVGDFAETLTQEMDFRLEGLNMDEFNAIFDSQPDKHVCAPRVYWERTRTHALTMERFVGCRVDDVERMKTLDDPEAELVRGVLAWTETLLRNGMFHGDVHAGNLMYLDDGRIGFLDFGIVGRFDQTTREQSMEFLLCLAMSNYKRFAEIVIDMSKGSIDGRELDVDEVAEDLRAAYGPLTNMTMAEIEYGEVLPNIQRTGMKHGLRFPKEFVLITKQFLYFDRYARLLAPNLNMFQDPRIAMQIMQLLPQLQAAQSGPSATV
ncbi:MAG: AarF/UbiB family protein [Polyangiales bacterium]